MTEADIDVTMLGGMLCSGGDCDRATATKCCVAWEKFRKLLPVLTTRHLSLNIHGNVYTACVSSAMLHGAKCRHQTPLTCRPQHDPLDLWHQSPRQNPLSSTTTEIGIEDITAFLHSRGFRWYGHIQRATSCIKSVIGFLIPTIRG